MSYAPYRNYDAALGAVSVIPGLDELDADSKQTFVQLTSAMRGIRFDAAQYSGLMGRIRQFASAATAGPTAGASVAASAALSTGEAQQLVVALLARIHLAVKQAKRMETAYAAGNPEAIALANRLVSQGRDAERIASAIASAASAVTGTSGLGLTAAGLTVMVGLFLAPITGGTSIPGALLIAAALTISGLDETLTQAARIFGIPSVNEIFDALVPKAIQDAGKNAVDNLTKPLGYMVAIIAGALAVGVIGYIGWNVYVARKTIKRVTGNRRRVRRNARAEKHWFVLVRYTDGFIEAFKLKDRREALDAVADARLLTRMSGGKLRKVSKAAARGAATEAEAIENW